MNRRELITGLISLVAAPAIVRAGSLMPVKVMLPEMSGRDIAQIYYNQQRMYFFAKQGIYYTTGLEEFCKL